MNFFSFQMNPANPAIHSVERDVVGLPRNHPPTHRSQLQIRSAEFVALELTLERLGKPHQRNGGSHEVSQHIEEQ